MACKGRLSHVGCIQYGFVEYRCWNTLVDIPGVGHPIFPLPLVALQSHSVIHDGDVIGASWRHEAREIGCLFNRGNIKAQYHWHLLGESTGHRWDSFHKGTVVRNAFPCLDVIMRFEKVPPLKLISPQCRIYASVNRVGIRSDYGLSPIRHQVII